MRDLKLVLRAVLVTALLSTFCAPIVHSQNFGKQSINYALPEAPKPKVVDTSDNYKFWDFGRTSMFTLNVASRGYDTYETCHGFAESKEIHEKFLLTDNCQGVALYNAGFTFGSLALEYALFKTGHRKLARIPQVLSFAGAAVGIGYTLKHK